jgi:hypothetical protein
MVPLPALFGPIIIKIFWKWVLGVRK